MSIINKAVCWRTVTHCFFSVKEKKTYLLSSWINTPGYINEKYKVIEIFKIQEDNNLFLFSVSRLKLLQRVNIGTMWGAPHSVLTFFISSMSHFYKVLGGHDTETVSVIWKVTGSRAGGGVACPHPRVSTGARETRPRVTWQEAGLERLKTPGWCCFTVLGRGTWCIHVVDIVVFKCWAVHLWAAL